jgi:predicted dehydrogenase
MGLPVLKLIQVGLGFWGRDWAETVLPEADVEVVAFVDSNPAVLPAERGFTSLDEALATTDADAVLATVSINAHTPVALAALRAGKHLLLEKPFAPTLREARVILEESRRQGVILSIAENYRFFPPVQAARQLVGELGPINTVTVDFRKALDPIERPGRDPIDSALLVQIAIHHFDVMRAVLGQEPLRVSCHSWSPPWTTAPADVCAVATIEFDGGAVVNYTGSMASRSPETPWWGEWRIEGEHGELVFGDQVELRGCPMPLPEPPLTDRAAVLAGFIAAIRDGTEPPSPGEDNIRSVALMDAAVESAATGRTVEVRAPERI